MVGISHGHGAVLGRCYSRLFQGCSRSSSFKESGFWKTNGLADGLGEIHHTLEHELNVIRKAEFEAAKERSIRNFGEAAEIPEFPADAQKEDEQGIREYREDLLG